MCGIIQLTLAEGSTFMAKLLILIPAITAVLYILYLCGILEIGTKRALVFIGSKGTRRRAAKFTSCSGSIKCIVRFPSEGAHNFRLNSTLSKGTLTIELLNKNKEPLFTLSESGSAKASLKAKMPYYLITSFNSATGEYELTWD